MTSKLPICLHWSAFKGKDPATKASPERKLISLLDEQKKIQLN